MKYKKTVLSNGLRIITVPMPDSPSVTIEAIVETGSLYEAKELNGISHLLEHMIFKGTQKRPKAIDISKELDSIGASYNASTGHNSTGFYAKAASKHFDKILDVISDLYCNPTLDAAELEKEKGVIVEEIRMYEDYPNDKVTDVSSELVYGDQPAGRGIAGTEKSVRSFTREQLIEYRTKHYVTEATTVSVAGCFDENEAIKKIEKAFSNVGTGNKTKREYVNIEKSGPKVAVAKKDIDQSHILLAFHSINNEDKRLPIQAIMSTILGRGMSSRLFTKMREELGICYYVGSGSFASEDYGGFRIWAGLDSARLKQGIEGILGECKRMASELISDEEISKARDNIAGGTMLALETSDALSDYYGGQEAIRHKIETPDEWLARINKVTVEEVKDFASSLFTDSNIYLAVVGRNADETEILKYLKF